MVKTLFLIVLISCTLIVFVNCQTISCYVCDSQIIDDNCKIINQETNLEQCLDDGSVPNFCYTQIDGTHVKRGCLDDQMDCNSDVNCNECEGEKCNFETVVPLECFVCNSETDQNCATLQQAITSKETCEDLGKECYVGITGSVTQRGCVSDGIDQADFGLLFQPCSNDNCNGLVYPANRLQCHQCNERDSCNDEQDDTQGFPCRNYDENDFCYTIGMGLYAQRGCRSDADEFSRNCDENENTFCKTCNEGNFCNGDDAVIATELSCYFCDESDPYCFAHVTETGVEDRTIKCEVFINYEAQCFTYSNETHIIRDCLNHVQRLSPPECIENPASCDSCTSTDEICNGERAVEIADSCISCDSTDTNCHDPEGILGLSISCYSHPDQRGCYLWNDPTEGRVERGCFTNIDLDTRELCATNGETCKTCYGKDCNQKLEFTTCYNCDSRTDVNCIDGGINPVICEDYLDTCVVYVVDDGETVRGCRKEVSTPPECPTRNCYQCDANECNGERFPDDRHKCVQCTSLTDSDCFEIPETSIDTFSATCTNYVSDDSCYTIVHSDHNLTRGCLSDSTPAAAACLNDERFCETCESVNCNTRQLESQPTLSCITCDQTDPKCEWGFIESDAEPCTETVFFDALEFCYTYQKDNEIQRGCVIDENKCMARDDECTLCNSVGCNNRHLTQSKCIICDSSDTEQEFCDSEIEDGDLTSCTNGIQLFERRGCYTLKTSTHVLRGCVSELNDANFMHCTNVNSTNCDICYDEGCNSKEANFANTLVYLPALTLICISVLTKLFNKILN